MSNGNAPLPVARPAGREFTMACRTIVAPTSPSTASTLPPTFALTLAEARTVAWRMYGTGCRAVVELLLLACCPDAPALARYQANMALEWFDPEVDLPRARGDEDESEAVRLLKTALLHGDITVRIAAGDELGRMLAPRSVWATARGGR